MALEFLQLAGDRFLNLATVLAVEYLPINAGCVSKLMGDYKEYRGPCLLVIVQGREKPLVLNGQDMQVLLAYLDQFKQR